MSAAPRTSISFIWEATSPGTRLNRLYKENVLGTGLIDELRPLFERYTCERIGRERFGDFCARVLWPEAGAKN